MSNPLLPLLNSALSALIAPAVTALTKAESDPQGALQELVNLIPQYAADLPTLENGAISEGAQLGLTLISDIQAKLSASTVTTPISTPESAPALSGTAGAE